MVGGVAKCIDDRANVNVKAEGREQKAEGKRA